jgi:nucleotide-binding universal stress UspA family protein
MPIKTILLHLADDERRAARLAVAASLAHRFGAFVEALYVAAPVFMPVAAAGEAASYGYIAEAAASAHARSGDIEQEARAALRHVSFSWSVAAGDPVERLARRAAYADLALVSQSQGPALDERLPPMRHPDRLPLYTPCPTLILPHDHPVDRPVAGRHILVAWRDSREAGVAVRNAQRFLVEAERVTVLTVDPPQTDADAGRDLIVYLERHGVRAGHRALTQQGDVGHSILDAADDLNCDMIVMGAYGHSRLRELVFGGATRTVMRHMRTPVLMSH